MNMTVERWRKISDQERMEFLNNTPMEIDSRGFFNKEFRAKIGPVYISGWRSSKSAAYKEGQKNLEKLNQVQVRNSEKTGIYTRG